MEVNLLKKNNHSVVYLLLTIDVIIVVLHLFLARNWSFFHLDVENNLPTAYQSLKLITAGLFFLLATIKFRISRQMSAFILPLAAILLFLGLDEWFQIHENIYRIFEFFPWFHPSKIVSASMQMGYRSSLWILYYTPLIFLFVLWSGYWLRVFQTVLKSNFWIIAVSISSLFVVLFTEILSSTGDYSAGAYFWLVTLEEMAEMLLASTLVLVGLKALKKGWVKHK